MAGEVRAVVDIGTNSVKLLVAEVADGQVRPLHESSHQTRLGQGFYETHTLQAEPIRDTARAVAQFRADCAQWQPARFRIIATSAARDAQNAEELLGAVQAAAGLPVEIISGEQEADWAYLGVTSDPSLSASSLLVLDVGGGSSEFILGRAGHRLFAESFRLGSVRLLERLALSDPPAAAELAACEREVETILQRNVRPHLAPLLASLGSDCQLVGTGGTSTILARIQLQLDSFDRERIEGVRLTHSFLQEQKVRLWSLPLEKRRQIVGLPPNRADVILTGLVIFERVMAAFGLPTLRASTRGIRFAALMAEYQSPPASPAGH